MLLIAGVLNLISSYLIASVAGSFVAIYVVFFAFIVINIEILSLFNGIYDYNILILTVLNLIFSIIFFRYKKAGFLKPDIDFKKIKNALLLDKFLIILLIAFISLISVSLFLAYIAPPLEPDSQVYHFLRAYYFYNNHSLAHFDTNDVRGIIMPINSEIVYAWILALKHKYYNFALLSYFSYFAVIVSLWQILSYMKYSIRRKLFAIFVFSSFASVVVEMSCLQTDIVVGALVLSSFALFLKKHDFLSALSLAIALGTKTTAFVVALPYLLILYLLNKKDFLRYILYLTVNFIIFSSYNYILNFIHFQNPVANNCSCLGHGFWGGIYGYISNLIHFCFQFLDFTGFTWGYYLNNKIFALQDAVFNFINLNPVMGSNVAHDQVNITTDEQIVGFGILGFLALIPAIFKGMFSKKKIICMLAFSFVLNILILARLMAYMEYSIRFILTFVCFCSPVLVLVYSKKGVYKTLICLFCIFYMGVIPYHIRRIPFLKVMSQLKKVDYNLDKFVDECFEGNFVSIWNMTPFIKKTIEEKYPDAKKIGYVKTSYSSALYLKMHKDIDFLNGGLFDKYDLSKYDLLILEGETQDDNNFKEADIKYTLEGTQIRFSEQGLNCFYTNAFDVFTTNKKYATKRWCFTTNYLDKNKDFKLDYVHDYKDSVIEKNIYFYKNITH